VTAPAPVIVGVELNARAVVEAMAAQFHEPPYKSPPQTPVLFFKTANTWIAGGEAVICPRGETGLEVRPNLVLVIGTEIPHRRFDTARLHDHLAGYRILNDLSLPIRSFHRPPVRAKGFDTFGPLGPAVGRDVIGDPGAVAIETRINGESCQRASTADLVRGPAELVQAITDIMALRKGDMVALGAPAEPIECGPGDRVTIAIDGIGRLSNPVVAEP
jgi:5-oxopent-3-ene-1,2,5-tricarboxylate decarboxylase/2-hydroxyhepta-2,4-diene-1,7-dioate isomerase